MSRVAEQPKDRYKRPDLRAAFERGRKAGRWEAKLLAEDRGLFNAWRAGFNAGREEWMHR